MAITPSELYPPVRGAGPAAPDPRYALRQVLLEVRVNNVPVQTLLWVRCRFSFAEPVASAQFMCALALEDQPGFAGGADYNSTVEIRAGCLPGQGAALRFQGRLRAPSGDYSPRAVTYTVVGQLQFAAEYINGQVTDPDSIASSSLGVRMTVGGLLIPDILGRPLPWDIASWWATAADIVARVLYLSGVSFDVNDIQSSDVLYGLYPFAYLWSSGTPTTDNVNSQIAVANPLGPRQAGETALAYIQRYDQVDAEWDGANAGGFYRTSEGVGGRVYRWRIGGRPSPDVVFTLTENLNILDGNIERRYPTGNSMIVTGSDWGGSSGGMVYAAQRSNPYMPQGQPFYAPDAPSSQMIEWATIPMRDDFTSTIGSPQPLGQNCQTIAEAALLEANKITPAGHVVTAEDFLFTQGQSVLIQGDLGGGVGRLLSGEPFWIQGVTFDCGYGTSGEPNITTTLEVQGGGLDASNSPPPA